jgi:peptide methionine sulfoxide reductase msrA/msrB
VKNLTHEELYIIDHKGTERAFSGKYFDKKIEGIYKCRKCDTPLFKSDDKFDSRSGWPSFDDMIGESVKELPDADGHRVEIVCAKCGAHLGHVFRGEGFTPKSTRHCVNSVSIELEPNKQAFSKAYFGAGCFWGVEYFFELLGGVESAVSGYMGGEIENPTYEQVCTKTTGHIEVVEVNYDPKLISYEQLLQIFFSIHDFSQENGQGPDIGPQYLSTIFTSEPSEILLVKEYIQKLKSKGEKVATTLHAMVPFYKAEEYHQDYYFKHQKLPYCHNYTPREF